MRKFLWFLSLPALLFSGCQIQAEALPAESEYSHIYDECHALTPEDSALYNERLEQISSSRLLNAFVVITDHLEGSPPDQFAQNYYQAVADQSVPDGFLILINNDTNQDYFFTTGRCSFYIPPSEAIVTISGATYSLIEANYPDALDLLLAPPERIPSYILDQTSTLTLPESQEFSDKLQAIYQDKQIRSALLLLPFPDDLETLNAELYRSQFGADSLLLIDPQKKLCSVVGDVPDFSQEEFFAVWNEQSLAWAIRYFLNSI